MAVAATRSWSVDELLDTLRDYAVVETNLEGIVVGWNAAAETLFATPRIAAVGQSFELLSLSSNASPRLELKCYPLRTSGGEHVGSVYVYHTHPVTGEEPRVRAANDVLPSPAGHTPQAGSPSSFAPSKAMDLQHERLLGLVELANDFVGMSDPHGYVIYQNPAANRMLGFAPNENLQGRHLSEMHPPWAAAKIREHALPAALRDGSYTHETALLHNDGTEIPVSQTMVVHRNAQGEVEYYSTIMRDLRGQKRAEELLANVASHVQGMLFQFARSPDGDLRFLYASPGSYELCGVTPEELARDATPFADRVHPDDIDRVFQALMDSQERDTPWSVDYRYLATDGSVRWHRGLSTSERLLDGSTLWHGFICDVTKEHEAALELAQSKLQFEQAIAALEHGFAMFDEDERLIVCNDAYAKLYHVSDRARKLRPRYEELIRMTAAEHPELLQWLPPGMPFEQWIAHRLHEFRTQTGESLQWLNGHWIRVDERKTVTGGTVSVRTDITQLKQAEFEALLHHERLRVAARTGGFGIWEWETDSGKLTWDARMCELYDYDVDDFPGNYAAWRDRLHPDDVEQAERIFAQSVAQRGESKSRFRIVHRNGNVRHIEAQWTCVLEASGATARFVGVNSDVTEEVESQTILKRHAEAALAASKAKAEFLATMSHEIRTPMNGVIGMTNLLIGTQLDGQQREYVETIRASGESLLSLINNILDFSKMEAGKLVLENVPFAIDQAVVQSITLFTSQAETKGVQLLHVLPSEPVIALGDPTRFKQILMNLVSNALKFTSSGEVKVTVRTRRVETDSCVVELEVSDTGIGIAPGHLARLGEAFVQADASTTRQYGGTGLGLSICQSLIHAMNGSIAVTSELNRGTTFCVQLPLGVATGLEPATETSTREPVVKLGRVLVAEDNAVNRRVVGLMLKTLANHVDFATDGREALALFTNYDYDCVLMDGQMPEMDGLEATRHMRAYELANARRKTPIVALTANALPGDREAFLAAGMDEYLTKPVRSGDLLVTLERLASR